MNLILRALAVATLFGVPAVAQNKAKRKKRTPRVITLGEQVIEGVVQKPEAFYILQRSELNFKGLEPKKSFIPLILKSVEKEPF